MSRLPAKVIPASMFALVNVAVLARGFLPGVVYAALKTVKPTREFAATPVQTRRGALQVGVAALTARASVPAPTFAASSAPASADAELIRLCGVWQSIDRDLNVLSKTRITIEIEQQTQAEVGRLLHRQSAIESEIEECLPPKTIESATVVARLALEAADRWDGDYRCVRDVCHHMAWDALALLCRWESTGRCGAGGQKTV